MSVSLIACLVLQLFHVTNSASVTPQILPIDWNAAAQSTLKEALLRKPNNNVAKNVIIFVGDGMGLSSVTAGRVYTGQTNGATGEEWNLSFDKFPNVALSKTYNVNHQVADSAGTATAFLTGVKTNLGVIGVNEKVTRKNCDQMSTDNSVTSILRWSLNEGKRAGVVTTTRITHATPASSYAHSPDRDWEADSDIPADKRNRPLCTDIAYQLVTNNSDINVILGGGRAKFLPNTTADMEYPNTTGSRSDNQNLIQVWENKMRQLNKKSAFVWNKAGFDAATPETTDYLLGLFEPSHMKYSLNRSQDGAGEPSLAEMTDKAIRILSREPKGYFLLVEGGRIDHAHHQNYAKHALNELKEMDDAVQKALSLTNTDDTLIVVTADHSHVFSMGGYPSRGNPIMGIVDQVGFLEQPALDNMPYLTLMYANGVTGFAGRTNLTGIDTTVNDFQQPSLVPVGDETHGGEDVAIYAVGPMAHLFYGVHEQNYIAHVMAFSSCVGLNKKHCSTSYSSDSVSTQAASSVLIQAILAAGLLVYMDAKN